MFIQREVLFLCLTVTLSSGNKNIGCLEGWHKSTDRSLCFLIVQESMDWFTARDRCKNIGGGLAVFESAQDREYFKALLYDKWHVPSKHMDAVWIDGTDRHREGVWELSSGEPLSGSVRWFEGQPDDYGNEDCLACLTPSDRAGLLNDAPCKANLTGYICQTAACICDNVCGGEVISESGNNVGLIVAAATGWFFTVLFLVVLGILSLPVSRSGIRCTLLTGRKNVSKNQSSVHFSSDDYKSGQHKRPSTEAAKCSDEDNKPKAPARPLNIKGSQEKQPLPENMEVDTSEPDEKSDDHYEAVDPNATEATEERYDAIDASKMGMRNTSDEYEKPKESQKKMESAVVNII